MKRSVKWAVTHDVNDGRTVGATECVEPPGLLYGIPGGKESEMPRESIEFGGPREQVLTPKP